MAVQPGLCQTWSETLKTGSLMTSLNVFQATLKAKVNGQEVSTMVSTVELNVTTGKVNITMRQVLSKLGSMRLRNKL